MSNRSTTVQQHVSILAERDGGWVCQYCGRELYRSPAEAPSAIPTAPEEDGQAIYNLSRDDYNLIAVVDHDTPVSRGGTDDLDNLVLCCSECNRKKGAKTGDEYRALLPPADSSFQEPAFLGFPVPLDNYCKVPHALFDAFPRFSSQSELMVVLYVLRHTWGFHEYTEGKRITVDEFMNGRKRRDGSRLDHGIGMSAPAVRRGIERAVEHGFLDVEIDDRDAARVEKFYTLRLAGVTKRSPSDGTNRSSGGHDSLPRTEKATTEEKPKKNGVVLDISTVNTFYQSEFGAVTPLIDKTLRELVEEHGAGEVLDAMRIAVEANARKLSYVKGVLKRKKRGSKKHRPGKSGSIYEDGNIPDWVER